MQGKGDKEGQGRGRREGGATLDSVVNKDLSASEENKGA